MVLMNTIRDLLFLIMNDDTTAPWYPIMGYKSNAEQCVTPNRRNSTREPHYSSPCPSYLYEVPRNLRTFLFDPSDSSIQELSDVSTPIGSVPLKQANIDLHL
jgi:hypothetical protein